MMAETLNEAMMCLWCLCIASFIWK